VADARAPQPGGRRPIAAIVASVVWGVALVPAAFAALFSPMMFDSPGSTSHPRVVAAFVSVVSFPILCVASIVASWIAAGRYRAATGRAATIVPAVLASLPLIALIPLLIVTLSEPRESPAPAQAVSPPQARHSVRQIGSNLNAYGGVAAGADGDLYFIAGGAGGDAVKKISPDGTVAAVGSAIEVPMAIAAGARGDLYVARGGGSIVKIAPNGAGTSIASGRISAPSGLAVDARGDVYVAGPRGSATGASTVERIAPDGRIAAIGSGWDSPAAVAVDSNGNVYVVDAGNASVKKVAPNGAIAAVGSGWKQPSGIAADAKGNVYVADAGVDAVTMVAPDGSTSTVGSGWGRPAGIAVDSHGDVYVAAGGKIWMTRP
jgi:hypothetical protein